MPRIDSSNWARTRLAAIVAPGLLVAAASAGGGPVYDLATEFSSDSNPSGVWSFRHGTRVLPHVDAWEPWAYASAQPGWSESEAGSNRLPFVFRSEGAELYEHDWSKGMIVVCSTDPDNGVGNDNPKVVFTAPESGRVNVTGHLWLGIDRGRGNLWYIWSPSGELIAHDFVIDGDEYSSSKPSEFLEWEWAPGTLSNIQVCTGQEIQLELQRVTGLGEFSVVSMTVEYTSTCAEDLSGNCKVDGNDLGILLGEWGPNGGGGAADFNKDGIVDGDDLGSMLGAWGNCP